MCRAVVPRVGAGEREVTLTVNGTDGFPWLLHLCVFAVLMGWGGVGCDDLGGSSPSLAIQ